MLGPRSSPAAERGILFRSPLPRLMPLRATVCVLRALGFQQERGRAGAGYASGLGLINPPHFTNEQWDERNGSILGHAAPQRLCAVLLIHGTARGMGLSPSRGTPRPARHCLWDLPIGDKCLRLGTGRGLSSALLLCCPAVLVPRGHPASCAASRTPRGSSLAGIAARTAPRGHPGAARG